MAKFGERLRQAREDKKLTQYQLADLLSVNQITVSTWERGTREPSVDMIRQIAIALECDPNFLFGFD
ncbi:MAG: helix-turn-helix domain-containing protein [Firmicutes bacterium]|nr:helix-turn-helix domain-containing protein [Bacillota bacterium]